MDGRVQLPVNKYMRVKFQVPYFDTITEAGPVAVLANEKPSELWDGIHKRIQISVQKHGSKVIGVFAHEDCAGNPVTKNEQIKQLIQAKKKISRPVSEYYDCGRLGK
jgi:hypothetical protein